MYCYCYFNLARILTWEMLISTGESEQPIPFICLFVDLGIRNDSLWVIGAWFLVCISPKSSQYLFTWNNKLNSIWCWLCIHPTIVLGCQCASFFKFETSGSFGDSTGCGFWIHTPIIEGFNSWERIHTWRLPEACCYITSLPRLLSWFLVIIGRGVVFRSWQCRVIIWFDSSL